MLPYPHIRLINPDGTMSEIDIGVPFTNPHTGISGGAPTQLDDAGLAALGLQRVMQTSFYGTPILSLVDGVLTLTMQQTEDEIMAEFQAEQSIWELNDRQWWSNHPGVEVLPATAESPAVTLPIDGVSRANNRGQFNDWHQTDMTGPLILFSKNDLPITISPAQADSANTAFRDGFRALLFARAQRHAMKAAATTAAAVRAVPYAD